MAQIFPTDFEEKLTMAQDDYILFSDSEDGNKIKKAQYKNLKGEQGNPGQDGQDGAAATITVGTTSTLPAGSSATVSNTGTSSAAVFNFGIPKGDKGDTGNPGADGNDGAAATITVGTTTTLPAGSSATVTNVGTSSAAIFNFGIPKGDSGSGSGDVNGPASSTDGHLAVFDGLTGKIIKDGGAVPTGFTPGGTATTGYVVTKTADGYERQAPTGGVTSVNSQTGAVTLDADDISDSTTTNKFVTATDKSTWNGKQDALTAGTGISISSNTISVSGVERVFAIPSVGNSITDVVTWMTAGGTAIFRRNETLEGNTYDQYLKVFYWSETNRSITVGSVTNSGVWGYTITYDSSNEVTAMTYYTGDYVPSGGTDGQVLSKVSGSVAWANPTGGIQEAPNSPITGIKYVWRGSEVQYAALSQYYTYTPGDTEFRTYS